METFSEVLWDYPADRIADAVMQHIRRDENLPTPANLIAIMDPKPPQLCKATYIEYMKKGWENMTPEEERFARAYERQQLEAATGADRKDPLKQEVRQHELEVLRREIINLKRENAILRQAWQEQRAILAAETGKTEAQRREEFAASCKQSPFDKVAATIRFMQQQGSSAEDIAAFQASQGAA